MQHLVETAAAHLQIGVPISGRIIRLGGDVETIESIRALAGIFAIELACGSIDLQGCGMPLGEILAAVRHQGCNMQRIPGAPDAAFAVDEGLDALFQHLSPNIETAGGAFVAAGNLEVGCAAARLCHHGERLAIRAQGEGGQTVAIRLSGCEALQLEIKHFHLCTRHGLGGNQIRRRHPYLPAAGIIRHQAKVAGEQLDCRETAGLHVVGCLLGILGLRPFVLVPIVVIVPVVRAGPVPFRLILLARFPIRAAGGLQRLLASVEALVQAETQAYAVDRTRLLLEQPAQVDTVVVPLMQVLGGIQSDISLINQAAAAAKVAVSPKIVVLQEHEYILLVNLHHAHLHGRKIHRAEGQQQILPVRQDVAFHEQAHGRSLFALRENAHEILSQSRSALSLQALVQSEGEIPPAPFEVHFYHLTLHLHITAHGATQFHHALHGRIRRRLAHHHLHAVVFDRCLHHAEGLAVIRHLLRFCQRHQISLHGDAEGEDFRRARDQFAEGEGDGILLPHLQGAFFGHEAHRLRAVPLHAALDGRFEAEETLLRLGSRIFRKLHADGGAFGDNAAGKCLDVGCKILSRGLHGLLGPAGDECQRSCQNYR